MALHSLELEWIYALQQLRTPALDAFFKVLNLFDTLIFYFLLIPIVWLGVRWKAGLKLFYILCLSSLTNYLLKAFFASPRPFHLDPSVAIIQVKGYGFPSGAAQTVILLSGLLIVFWKNSWKWVVAGCYIFFISLSRVYLGVHFPSDILGGWIVGFILWAVYIYLFPLIEKQLKKWSLSSLFFLSQGIPLLLFLCLFKAPQIRMWSIAMGMGMGVFISCRYHLLPPPVKSFRAGALRAIVGIAGVFLWYAFILSLSIANPFYIFILFFLLGLWLSLGTHILCQKIPLLNDESSNWNRK